MALLQQLFDITITACVAAMMFTIGILIDSGELSAYFAKRKRRLSLLVIFINILLIPALSLWLVRYFPLDDASVLLLLLCAFAPAAPVIPALVQANRGDIHFSISLLFALNLLSFFSIPLYIDLARHSFPSAFAASDISSSIFFQRYAGPILLPLLIGVAARLYLQTGQADRLFHRVSQLYKLLGISATLMIGTLHGEDILHLRAMPFLILLAFTGLCMLITWLALLPLANRQEHISALIASGLRNFVIIILLVNVLTEDKALLLYVFPVALLPIIAGFLIGAYRERRRVRYI